MGETKTGTQELVVGFYVTDNLSPCDIHIQLMVGYSSFPLFFPPSAEPCSHLLLHINRNEEPTVSKHHSYAFNPELFIIEHTPSM